MADVTGEVRVTGSTGGRPITLDPLTETEPLHLPRRRVETAMAAGFQLAWADGETEIDGETWRFDLTVGAGLGSRWMCFTVTAPDGTRREEVVSAEDLITEWLHRVVREGPTPVVEP